MVVAEDDRKAWMKRKHRYGPMAGGLFDPTGHKHHSVTDVLARFTDCANSRHD